MQRPEQQEQGQQGDGEQEHQVHCWACNVLVQIPLVGEQRLPSPQFKCGWCGAITDTFIGRRLAEERRAARRRTCFGATMLTLSSLQWVIVLIVFALICSIIIVGAAYVLPSNCGDPISTAVHHSITFGLTFLILFNYAATILTSPGTVGECWVAPVQPGEQVPPGAYDNVRYCSECKGHKPVGAHHCSTCRACIMDQDHHCPFVNNCVGRANMRSFIQFTGWVVAAMLFCLGHTGWLLSRNSSQLRSAGVQALRASQSAWDLPTMILVLVHLLPAHVIAALYISLACVLVLIGVSMLFSSTVNFIAAGHLHDSPAPVPDSPYHPQQQPQPAADGAAAAAGHGARRASLSVWGHVVGTIMRGYKNLSHVMGGPGLGAWVMPRWGPPPGVLKGLEKSGKKRA